MYDDSMEVSYPAHLGLLQPARVSSQGHRHTGLGSSPALLYHINPGSKTSTLLGDTEALRPLFPTMTERERDTQSYIHGKYWSS